MTARALTRYELETVCETAEQCALDALAKVWEFLIGTPLADLPEGADLDPSAYAIPKKQASAILDAARGELHLPWLNIGPGSY